jgi:hypothetical protein
MHLHNFTDEIKSLKVLYSPGNPASSIVKIEARGFASYPCG